MCMMEGLIESIIIDQNLKIESRGSIQSEAVLTSMEGIDPFSNNKLHIDCIAEKYRNWLESPHFDIGISTS